MADPNAKPSKPSAPAKDTIVRDIAIVFGVAGLLYITTNITPITVDSIISGDAPSKIISFFGFDANLTAVQTFLLSLQNALVVLAAVFLAGSFWLTLRINKIHHKEHERYEPVHIEEIEAKAKLIQWQVVLDHVNSESPAEWKLAILEADSMLDEILDFEGYQGESVGEKLKSMDPLDLPSYSDAWEAHKVRNQIAHEGATMDFSKKIARDTITKYGKVFKDFGHI